MNIPGYPIERKLAENNLSELYLAHNDSGNAVAIKVINNSLSGNETFRTAFLERAALLQQSIPHPHCLCPLDTGATEKHCYIVTDYFPNGSLKKRMLIGLSPRQSLQLGMELASALDHIHRAGFIHQGVHPDNIFLHDDGSAVLAEVDIIKDIATQTGIHLPPGNIDNTRYTSPEALQNTVIKASDYYSLGQVLNELLARKLSFESEVALSGKVACYQPLLDKLLAEDPEQRIQNKTEYKQCYSEIEAHNNSDSLTQTAEPQGTTKIPANQEDALNQDIIDDAVASFPSSTSPFKMTVLGIGIISLSALISYYGIGFFLDEKIAMPKRHQLIIPSSQPAGIRPSATDNNNAAKDTSLDDDYQFLYTDREDSNTDAELSDAEIHDVMQAKEIEATPENQIVSSQIEKPPEKQPTVQQPTEQQEKEKAEVSTSHQVKDDSNVTPQSSDKTEISTNSGAPEKMDNSANAALQALLQRADQQIRARKLTTPKGDNAYATLQQVLQKAPNNTQAKQKVKKISDLYLLIAKKQVKKNPGKAIRFLNTALSLTPGNIEIVSLRNNLAKAEKQKQQQISGILQQAKSAMDSMQLVPAWQHYQTLLKIAPTDKRTRGLLQDIANIYIKVANNWKLQGLHQDALSLVQEGRKIIPFYSPLQNLETELREIIAQKEKQAAEPAQVVTTTKQQNVEEQATIATPAPPIRNSEPEIQVEPAAPEPKPEKKKIRTFGTF